MANVILNEEHLTNIANAIRNKKGTTNQMLPSQMANEISSIKTATSSSGIQVKTGTTSSPTINTGLSNIDKLIIYADKIKSIGVVTVVYSADVGTANVIYCDSYSLYLKACDIVDLSGFSVSGGTFSWTETMDAFMFMSNSTYNWIAIGT